MNESEFPLLVVAEPVVPCEASRGFERHNAGACGKPAGHEVSGVHLCSYHNAVRGYVPVLYLADGRGMNHAGVVGTPPPQPTAPAAGIVDALVGVAERMTPTSIPPSEAELAPRACIPPPCEPVPVPPFMSTDSAVRKGMPVATGFVEYFPDAMLIASMVSLVGAVKHCGAKLGWDKSKSADEPDAELRHMIDRFRKDPADPGLEALAHLGHYASKLWRAAADAQRACDAARAAFKRGEDWRK